MSVNRDEHGRGTSAAPVARLRFDCGADEGRSVEVREGETITFGRDVSIEHQINDPAASRAHFAIKGFQGHPYIKDLKSRNGTFVNGSRVETVRLRFGDEVRVGETIIIVEESPIGAEESPADPAASEPRPLDPAEAAAMLAESRRSVPNESPSAPQPSGKTDPLIGKTIAGYRIVALKGRGGMGTVYRAEQLSLHREVALKVLASRLTKDRTFVDLFFREARAAGQLNHPNIVQVYDVGQDETGEIYFYSMEFIEDGSIQSRIDKAESKKLPVDDAARAMLDAARGILYAERKKIVHRDIKPDNLMLGEDGIVKIADLGLAKSLNDGPRGEEGILGTPHFISPEQVTGKEVDTRSDLYSLGASFYRILTGVNPYPGKTVKEIILQRLKQPPRPLREIDPEVPEDFARIIEKLMQREPAARYQSAEDLVHDLEQMIRVHHFGAGSKKGLYAALALALVAVSVLVGVVLTRDNGTADPIVIDDPETIRKLAVQQENLRIATVTNNFLTIENSEQREGQTEEVAKRYDEFVEENKNAQTEKMRALVAKAETNAKRIRDAIAAEKARVQAERAMLASAIEAIEKAVNEALEKGEIGLAKRAIPEGDAASPIERSEHKSRLDGLRRKVADSAAKLREDVKAAVATLLKEFQHRKAFDEIDRAIGRLQVEGDATAFAAIVQELRKLRVDVETALVADGARRLELDRAEFYTTVTTALKDVDARRFDAAAAALAPLVDKLGSDEYRELAREWVEDAAAAARIARRAIEVGASRIAKGEAVEMPLAAYGTTGARARARAIDATRSEVEVAGGVSEVAWADYHPASVFVEAIEAALGEPSDDDRRDLVILSLLLQARERAKEIGSRLPPGPATDALRARVDREIRALELYDEAKTALKNEGEYERPLEVLGTLQKDYPDTQLFLRRSNGDSHFFRKRQAGKARGE